VINVDSEIEKASTSVLAGEARYVGHLDMATMVEFVEEAQNDHVDVNNHIAVLDDIPVLVQEDVDSRDAGDMDVSSAEEEGQVVEQDTFKSNAKEKERKSKCVLS
jgi:hypothetical protein